MNAQAILEDLTARGVRVWAEGDRLKLDAPAGILTDDDKAKLVEAKPDLLRALQPTPGTCPTCRAPMDLQDRARDCWYCAGCRAFFDGQGREFPVPVTPRPLTLEVVEARQLLADLQAAGCGITWDGDELRISNLSKIPTALWLRLENADSDFMNVAKEMAGELEPRSAWVN